VAKGSRQLSAGGRDQGVNPKSEIRNPKSESEIRNPKSEIRRAPMTEPKERPQKYDLEERTFLFARAVRLFIKQVPRSLSNYEDRT